MGELHEVSLKLGEQKSFVHIHNTNYLSYFSATTSCYVPLV